MRSCKKHQTSFGIILLRFVAMATVLITFSGTLASQDVRPVYTGTNYATISEGEPLERIVEKAS
ncbi:MAG: hypothetical protein JXA23_09185, partial [Bacteroidales bacterium]|nr:hypothetical protein [Bacteroidales bacterium]